MSSLYEDSTHFQTPKNENSTAYPMYSGSYFNGNTNQNYAFQNYFIKGKKKWKLIPSLEQQKKIY